MIVLVKTGRRTDDALPRICILEEDKTCDDCCECYVCDLDPEKICDNCGECLEIADYSGVIVDDVIVAPPEAVRPGDRRPVIRRLLRPRGGVFRMVPVRSDPS